ncbi:hypothetical protein PNOK_0120000 [Pyrrhoderma noxium]|uniref:Uncharacterized protein n=1 Tax=Pyrrhoderma noxium TaxID=2282107 RepID=A0A286UX71_9AGAM|nr:hypothetical protein PNOK_0120000 [Pyrrhoderma noxium]
MRLGDKRRRSRAIYNKCAVMGEDKLFISLWIPELTHQPYFLLFPYDDNHNSKPLLLQFSLAPLLITQAEGIKHVIPSSPSLDHEGSSLSSYKANPVKSSSSITLNGLSGVVSSSGHRQAHNVSGDVSSTSTGAQSGVQSGIPLQRLPLHRSSSLTSLGSHCSMEQTTSAEKRKTPGSGALDARSLWVLLCIYDRCFTFILLSVKDERDMIYYN